MVWRPVHDVKGRRSSASSRVHLWLGIGSCGALPSCNVAASNGPVLEMSQLQAQKASCGPGEQG